MDLKCHTCNGLQFIQQFDVDRNNCKLEGRDPDWTFDKFKEDMKLATSKKEIKLLLRTAIINCDINIPNVRSEMLKWSKELTEIRDEDEDEAYGYLSDEKTTMFLYNRHW